MTERDFDANPYSPDEQRVADWLHARAPQVGSGDDPIGFVLASYNLIMRQRNAARDALEVIIATAKNSDVARIAAQGLDEAGEPGPYPTPDDMQAYWRRAIGDTYHPVALGLTFATHPVTVKRVIAKLLNREVCPEAADVIVSLIHREVRSTNLINDLSNQLAENGR